MIMPRTPEPPSPPDSGTTRRELVRSTMATAVALGLWPVLSAGAALNGGAQTPPLKVLSAGEAAVYDAWCDQLAPGAAQVGASRYLDAQLAAARDEAFLFLRVLANPPFEDFYGQGIAGIDQEARARFGASFVTLDESQRNAVVDAAAADETIAWESPAPSFFLLVSRGDAVDVAYGTEAGFRRLHVPYLAHLRPPAPW